jgi:molybdopterin-guanine dinucleotide biosynthesis protein A
MGRDKALLVVDGQPMVRRVAAAAVRAGAAAVLTVGGDAAGLRAALAGLGLDVEVVPDDHPGEGPLGGILTALRRLPDHDRVLVVACDLLSPDPPTMAATVDALTSSIDVAVPRTAGQSQWMHAAWRKTDRLETALEARFAAGERSVHRAVATAQLRTAGVTPDDPAALADADTPGDLPGTPGSPGIPDRT